MASDLDRVLTAAHVPGPYLLVGHSFGAMITRLYAQQHPEKTAGLVFVDAFGTNMQPFFAARWPAYLKLLNNPGTPFDADPRFEKVDIEGAVGAVKAAKPLPKVPMAVLSKTEPFATPPGARRPSWHRSSAPGPRSSRPWWSWGTRPRTSWPPEATTTYRCTTPI